MSKRVVVYWRISSLNWSKSRWWLSGWSGSSKREEFTAESAPFTGARGCGGRVVGVVVQEKRVFYRRFSSLNWRMSRWW